MLAKSGIGNMYSARVLHGLIERIEAEPVKFIVLFFVLRVNFLKKKPSSFEWRSLQAEKRVLLRVKIHLIVFPGSYL